MTYPITARRLGRHNDSLATNDLGRRKSPKRRTLIGLLTLGLAVAGSITFTAPAAAAVSFTQLSLTAVVNETSVTATAKVKASSQTTVQLYGVCVRNKSNANVDYQPTARSVLTVSGTTWTGTKTFPVGTYSYFSCVKKDNRWWDTGPGKQFIIAATSPSQTPSPTPSPAPTSSPTAPPSGSAMPVGNLSGWDQIFAEDFTTPAALGQVGNVYGQSMRGYDGFGDTSRNGTYTPDRVLSVFDGSLDYYLHTEGGKPRVAAPTLMDYAGQTYGRYSVRFKSDNMPGYKIAFLLWPSSDVWNEGEIDWPEGNLNGRMSPASARKGTYSNGQMTFDPPSRGYSATDSSGWHVATTEWSPGIVKWFWDGVLVTQTTVASGVPTTPFRWTLQAETALDGTTPAAATGGHLKVDWAVAYRYRVS